MPILRRVVCYFGGGAGGLRKPDGLRLRGVLTPDDAVGR